ncbi:MAG TPA: hypothetical protein VF756_18110 [Thermoanaerobaculia bacterium]
MRTFYKTAFCLVAVLAGSIGLSSASRPEAAEAALRTHAQSRIAELIKEWSVRPVEQAAVDKDANLLAASLTSEQLGAIAGGEDVAQVIEAQGGLRSVSAAAIGDFKRELVFVPLPPCRVIDTRVPGQALQPAQIREFKVAGTTGFSSQGGNPTGCGVPAGAVNPNAPAVVVNVIAVNPPGSGFIRAWATGTPMPSTSVVNFANVPGLAIANGIVVSINGTSLASSDLTVLAEGSPVHFVVDVTGYFTRFPVEQVEAGAKSITVIADGGGVDLSGGACTEVNSCTVSSQSNGQMIVRTWTQVRLNHATTPGGDRIAVGVKNFDPTTCSNNDQSINATDFEVPESHPNDSSVDTTMSHKRIFPHSAGTRTYYINARMITGASSGDVIESSRMICTFIPNDPS